MAMSILLATGEKFGELPWVDVLTKVLIKGKFVDGGP
jgi:hypothetical protein